MASVKIFLYTHKTLKDDYHPIVLQLIKDRKRKLIKLGISLEEHWNFSKEIPNNKHEESKVLRQLIRKKKNLANSAIIELDDIGKPYTVEDIAEKLDYVKKQASFIKFCDKIIEHLETTGKNGNARIYKDAKSALIKFNKGRDIDFRNLTKRKLKSYEDYLEEKGLKVNSIGVHLRTIRAIYNKAINEELVNAQYYPFKDFRIRKERTIKRSLSKEDIKKIVEIDLNHDKELDFARDIFMFSFYNRGICFIDIFYLTNQDVNNGRVEYKRKKTKQLFSIKLTQQAKEIINKYKLSVEGDYVFPILNAEDEYKSYKTGLRLLNKRLKRIGEALEFGKPLTSYVARHSWATIAKRSGISTSIISEGLGHDSELTTQIYLDSFENKTLDDANDLIITLLD